MATNTPSVADKAFESRAAGGLPFTLTRASLPAPGTLVARKGNIPPPPSLPKAQQICFMLSVSESTKLGGLTPNETIMRKRVRAPTQLVSKTQTESNGVGSNNTNDENLKDYDTPPFTQRKRMCHIVLSDDDDSLAGETVTQHMKAVTDDGEAAQAAESKSTSHDMDKQTASMKNRPKMADYPPQDCQVIGTAIEFYHALLLTENPFSEPREELDWVREAFDASRNYHKVSSHTELDPSRIKIITARGSNLQGQFKSSAKSFVASSYGFQLGDGAAAKENNRKLVTELKCKLAFTCHELCPHPTSIYKNNVIQQVINEILFKKKDDEGIKWAKYYDPFPKVAFALTLTAIEWATGKRESVHFKEDKYKGLYKQHLKTLDYFDEQMKKQGILLKILQGIFDNGRSSAGVDDKQSTSIIAITSDLIDDAIEEFDQENGQIEEIEEKEEQSGWWLKDETQLEWDVEDKMFEGLDESVEPPAHRKSNKQRFKRLTTVQTSKQQISSKPFMNCTTSSPHLNKPRIAKSLVSKKLFKNSVTSSPFNAQPIRIRKWITSVARSHISNSPSKISASNSPTLNGSLMHTSRSINDAAECLLKFANTVNEDVRANKAITDFLTEFMPQCITALERVGNEASNAGNQDEAVAAYSTVLSLGPAIPNAVLTKWATIMLSHGSADEALSAATKFKVLSFAVYHVICDNLERNDRLIEAVEFFQQMQNKLPENAGVPAERVEWELDFHGRCSQKLGKMVDMLRNCKKHDKAGALSVKPRNNDIPVKRSRENNALEQRRKKHLQFAELARENNIALVVDETYRNFVEHYSPHHLFSSMQTKILPPSWSWRLNFSSPRPSLSTTEKTPRDSFEDAKRVAPCLLFIDKIDAITPKQESAQREMERRIVTQFLTCMDGWRPSVQPKDMSWERTDNKPVIIIGATNRPDSLDAALRRASRFDHRISMGIPDEDARNKLRPEGDFDYGSLAKAMPGYVGADLSALTGAAGVITIKQIFTELSEGTLVLPDAPEMTTDNSDTPMVIDSTSHTPMAEAPPPPYATPPFASLVNQLSSSSIAHFLTAHPFPLTESQLAPLCITSPDFRAMLSQVQPSWKREGFPTVPDITWSDIGALHGIREDAVGIVACYSGDLLGVARYCLRKLVANESRANFISIKGPELLNKYVGESERVVRQVFSLRTCVVFFDDLDALVLRRDDSLSDSSTRVVNTLLTELDGLDAAKSVYVIGAMNRPDMINPAMVCPGRLDKLLYVDLPTSSERVEMLRTLIKRVLVADGSEDGEGKEAVERLVSERCDGADLAAVVREAGVVALRRVLESLEEMEESEDEGGHGTAGSEGGGSGGGLRMRGGQGLALRVGGAEEKVQGTPDNIHIEHPIVTALNATLVLQGDWAEGEALLDRASSAGPSAPTSASANPTPLAPSPQG
ncbi:hypothetical protein HD554DRAFT_2295666 [Boletus coccyginus]|nr:hypothetical protein HD554DRAFT_2295666 [Boletus coccyginus]